LLEGELFGHVRGAFTGAVKDRQGRFESADGGTVFLDEVGDIEPPTQVKLLRFLQSKEFERVGESVTRKVDVRIVAATNRNLEEAVGNGMFREDLYYRLNAVRLKLPPLREREGDIPLLIQHFLGKYGCPGDVSPGVIESLVAYPWKGNIRELENVIERAALLSRREKVQLHHLPEEFQNIVPSGKQTLSLEEMERQRMTNRLALSLLLAVSILTMGLILAAYRPVALEPFVGWLLGVPFVLALALGIWWVWSIWRSGRG
jgi:transcriptional regulator with GAF, ATPase, and Fis domain